MFGFVLIPTTGSSFKVSLSSNVIFCDIYILHTHLSHPSSLPAGGLSALFSVVTWPLWWTRTFQWAHRIIIILAYYFSKGTHLPLIPMNKVTRQKVPVSSLPLFLTPHPVFRLYLVGLNPKHCYSPRSPQVQVHRLPLISNNVLNLLLRPRLPFSRLPLFPRLFSDGGFLSADRATSSPVLEIVPSSSQC